MVLAATACWMGGFWSDALGEPEPERLAGDHRRCEDLMRDANLPAKATYYPLRAIERGTVDDLADKVRAVAAQDAADASRAPELVTLLTSIADACREAMHARRAADKVKENIEANAPLDVKTADKVAAAPVLREASALHALLYLDGPFADEARAIGLLVAIDRVEIARGLPKHLKVYAVEGVFADLFDLAPPALSGEAAAPIRSGTWLAYLGEASSRAGYPIPASARDPQEREPLAWNGMLQGLADQLRAIPAPKASSPLGAVVRGVTARIDRQFRDVRAEIAARPHP
jgi:hypothetical protein